MPIDRQAKQRQGRRTLVRDQTFCGFAALQLSEEECQRAEVRNSWDDDAGSGGLVGSGVKASIARGATKSHKEASQNEHRARCHGEHRSSAEGKRAVLADPPLTIRTAPVRM
eukprot:CAMPEP_0203903888 /NCGR_PEP_ID=MMETSP0359-20131031/45764_1 /ASSEMBLY_ACC=CAM_ASM_000338 /TAXON_ID=268821 /ORGANISM="Scrippsiella Hangoei, Strain SHTV-5" /LENGTH=111 /DNA_ID=CAMNT_0050828005 /DNA_START=77 /DNA_END=412 /DNA_ORIENTATION=-